MDLKVKQWANEILSVVEDGGLEIEATDESSVFIARSNKNNSVFDITLTDFGLVFQERYQIDNFDWDDTGLFNLVNSESSLLKCSYRKTNLSNDTDYICEVYYSFCYPLYAETKDLFEMTFLNFFKEIDSANKILEGFDGIEVLAQLR